MLHAVVEQNFRVENVLHVLFSSVEWLIDVHSVNLDSFLVIYLFIGKDYDKFEIKRALRQ